MQAVTFHAAAERSDVLSCDMHAEKTASELVRALRGRRSQVALSWRLGYRTNVIYSWESGRRWPPASELLRLAQRVGVDVRAAVARFYRTAPEWLASAEVTAASFVAQLLRDQQGDTPTLVVARRAGVNRFSAARWVAGTVEPRLPDFLRMIEATSLRLADFVASLVDPVSVPSVHEEWKRREAQRNAALAEPWTQAVLRVLETGERDEQGVTAALQIDPDVAGRCLALLAAAGQAQRTKRGWRAVEVAAVDTRRTPETARQLKSFWAGVALDRLRAGADGSWAYNVFSVSEDQLRRITELHNAYFQALRAVVAEDEPPECVALVHLQLLRLS
jgi:DNA-binding transcriptional regulator YiaG